MKNATLKLLVLLLVCAPLTLVAKEFTEENRIQKSDDANGSYTLIIVGHDWGPAVGKVVLSMGELITETNAANFSVTVERSAEGVEMGENEAKGNRKVIYAYVSDKNGNRIAEGNHVTLVLYVAPNDVLSSPIKYVWANGRGSNQWIDYKLLITDTSTKKSWDKEAGRSVPALDRFDLTEKFTNGNLTLPYASFKPQKADKSSPLIIWLHGGGEGGTDPSIPLVANKATNYASDEIQSIFGGAYVLVPQSPTFWMQSESGEYTRGDVNDIYNESLMALIKEYVAANPQIDADRIYVGGCSNGGYMALKLILLHPDYFAAGYISALAYHAKHIANEQIEKIKDVPIWFVHSKDDPVTIPEETVVPTYTRLVKAGAKNVHFSFYDHVVDISGFYGGDNYHYNGHWSWIYSHDDHADFGFDGNPVMIDNQPVTIMEWMAAQSK